MMHPTQHLRWRTKHNGPLLLEQLWVNDDQTYWAWQRVPLVPTESPMKGDGPPPIPGTNKETSS